MPEPIDPQPSNDLARRRREPAPDPHEASGRFSAAVRQGTTREEIGAAMRAGATFVHASRAIAAMEPAAETAAA